MKLCLLDGAPSRHETAAAVRRALLDHATRQGWDVGTFFLPDLDIADCAGDFNCWFKSPGVCSINDANRDVARGAVQSDLLVLLSPVTFGGYSADLKKGWDHIVQATLPFLQEVEGEVHHELRYERYPTPVGIGLMDRYDEVPAHLFRVVVARNALNMHKSHHASGVLHPGLGPEAIAAEAVRLLEGTDSVPHDTTLEFGPRPDEWQTELPALKSALVLVGSPRGAQSTSASLGRYLATRFEIGGVRTDTMELYATQRSPDLTARLLAATDAADLVVLSFPLYVDSLPAPVIRLFERVAAHRSAPDAPSRPDSQRLIAMVQCGFPEARHTHTALAISRQFAKEAGFVWAGGLALGGGHGLVQSRPLESLGRRAAGVRAGLDLTAMALARGIPVPDEAVTLMARPFVPAWMYRVVANVGWRIEARRRRISDTLRDRPYETV